MKSVSTGLRKSLLFVFGMFVLCAVVLGGRLVYLMILTAEHYERMAEELHERERSIKAARGLIYDRNGVVLADNAPVCTISVIHSQITEPERVIRILSQELSLPEATVRKRVEKFSSIERIKSNVPKEIADRLRGYELAGVMVDEDYKRIYPYGALASKVIGFTGGDNQGIVGLEVRYDSVLMGTPGKILTLTTAYGTEIENAAEGRVDATDGNSLTISLDIEIQRVAWQAAEKVKEAKNAKHVSLIVMNPQNGEIYAMANVPEFDLNEPFSWNEEFAPEEGEVYTKEQTQIMLNSMWRNPCISDTYEPGSTFKILTATAALEEGEVRLTDRFYCPGYKLVEDRKIRCHKAGGHGSETFVEGIKNSCNPVFMEIGARVGAERLLQNFRKVGLLSKTGIDLPGEAGAIMHKLENIKPVELATISFGQSFQITPMQLLCAVSCVINGGTRVTPHFGVYVTDREGKTVTTYDYPQGEQVLQTTTCETMKQLLRAVVQEGTGKRAYLPGFRIGGKTATSEKLPRSKNTYISSFIGFAPAENPQVLALVLIDEPEGIYYGGTIAAPVIAEVFSQILPYLGIEKEYSREEMEQQKLGYVTVPDVTGMKKDEVKKLLSACEFGELFWEGDGERVTGQFPLPGDVVNKKSSLILYLK